VLLSRFALSFAPAVAAHALVLLGLSTLARPAAPARRSDVLVVRVIEVEEAKPDPVRDPPPPVEPAQEPPPSPVPPAPTARPRHKRLELVRPKPADDVQLPAAPVDDGPPTPTPSLPEAQPAMAAPETTDVAPARVTSPGQSVKARPRYRSNPRPDYPIDSLRHREEGVVLLDVDVTADGRAAAVALARSSGFEGLDKAALETVKNWTFEPARTGGLAVASQVVVPVRFSLDGR
jgi:periplasmic protein TonB